MSTMTAPVSIAGKRQAPSRKDRQTQPMPSAAPVTEDRIRTRAFEIYQQRNGNGGQGDAASDWLQAERELNGGAPDPTASREVESRSRSRGETLLASGT